MQVKRAINEMHNDTRILINYLKKRLIDEKADDVSYKELTESIGGRDVRRDGVSHLLRTARKRLEKDYGVLVVTVFGYGLKLSNECGAEASRQIRLIHKRSSKQQKRILNAFQESDVDNDEKVSVFTGIAVLGTLNFMTGKRKIERLMTRIQEKGSELSTTETLKLFEE